MSGSITADAVRVEIAENSLVAGNPVKTAAKIAALASMPMYVDANSAFQSGALPFSLRHKQPRFVAVSRENKATLLENPNSKIWEKL